MNLIVSCKYDHRKIDGLMTGLIEYCRKVEDKYPQAAIDQARERLGTIESQLFAHFKKEEQFLFPELANIGVSVEFGPIGVALREHRLIKSFLRTLDGLMTELEQGRQSSPAYLINQTVALTKFLEHHWQKEETALFEIALMHIPNDRLHRLELLRNFE